MSGYDEHGREIGAGPTNVPPQPSVSTDPGEVYRFGPSFVTYVTGRFAALEQLLAAVIDQLRLRRPREGFRLIVSGNTDASGNADIVIFNTSPGQRFVLHRMYVHATGYTWAAPFNGAGEATIQTDGMSWSGMSFVSGSGQLPAFYRSGLADAVEAQDGEQLRLHVVAGPVSTQLELRCKGTLLPISDSEIDA